MWIDNNHSSNIYAIRAVSNCSPSYFHALYTCTTYLLHIYVKKQDGKEVGLISGTNSGVLFWAQVDTAKKQCNMQVSRLTEEVSALQMVWS